MTVTVRIPAASVRVVAVVPEDTIRVTIPGSTGGGGGGSSGPVAWGDVTGKPTEFPPEAHDQAISTITGLQTALDGKQASLGFTPEDSANKGQAGGYAPLDGTGKVASVYLPGFVDDVLEYADLAAFPVTGETGKMYVAVDTGKVYRWSGSAYVEISGSPGSTDAVTEGASNLYFTTARVLATALTGYAAAGSRTALSATDTVLGAFNKVGKWLSDLAAIAFSGSADDLTTGTLPAARFDDTAHGNRAGGSLHANAVASGAAGFMAGTDKAKLDGIASGATVYTDEMVDDRVSNLIVANNGLVSSYDDSGNALTIGLAGPRPRFEVFSDFTGSAGNDNVASTVSGTGAGNASVAGFGDNDIGVAQGTTGSTATGRSALATSAQAFRIGAGAWSYEQRVRIANLSTGTERYAILWGFWDTDTGVNQTDGVYFLYDEGGVVTGSPGASANFLCVTVSNGTRTFTTTTTAFNATTYYRLRIEINAAGTSVAFYIDGTLVATHTTNIPSGAGREVGFGRMIVKSVGTTARTCQEDYLHVVCDFTTPR